MMSIGVILAAIAVFAFTLLYGIISSGYFSGEKAQGLLFLFVSGIISLIQSFLYFRTKRKIQDTPTARLLTASAGSIQIQGLAFPYRKERDIFGRDVAFLSISLEKMVKRGKKTMWIEQWAYKTHGDDFHFFVMDDTAFVKVYPDEANLEIDVDQIEWSNASEKVRSRILSMVNESINDFPPSKFLGISSSNWRICERRILAGTQVLVRGNLEPYAQPQNIDDAAASAFATHMQRILARKKRVRIGYDYNKDNKIDQLESMRFLYETYRSSRMHSRNKPYHSDLRCQVVGEIRKEYWTDFYIANDAEREILKSLSIKTICFFVFGVIATASSAAFWISKI